ncbi:MAG: sugar phosphate isomerase/epimerase [Verrucomicrobia bacterium]|nr:sugar phosphate isomerase/epimerase [Verrucomicrobiota bacterium]MCH8510273.1 sugar phosphate isomerase/epimerase [Kiritimatiellia bacterium]
MTIHSTSQTLSASISDKAFAPDVPLHENLRRIRAAGFTHLHLAHKWTKPEAFTEAEETEWTRALSENGIQVLDVHGCHCKGVNLYYGSDEEKQRAMDLFVHRMRLTQRLGGNAMVYHVPSKGPIEEGQIEDLLEALRRVEDLSRELGVTIALENHYLLDNDRRTFSAAFETFDADFVGFTFDPGHALISGNTEWLLKHCVSRLQILHLNDNDTVKDLHWCPLDPEGNADWPAIMRFVSESPYTKPLQLEVSWTPDHHGSHETFLAEAFTAARTLNDMCG